MGEGGYGVPTNRLSDEVHTVVLKILDENQEECNLLSAKSKEECIYCREPGFMLPPFFGELRFVSSLLMQFLARRPQFGWSSSHRNKHCREVYTYMGKPEEGSVVYSICRLLKISK